MKTRSFKLCLQFLFCLGILVSCSRDMDDDIVPIYDLQLEGQDYLLLEIGEKITVDYKIIPIHATDKSLTWSSEDEAVATVDDGIITGVGIGNTRIIGISNSSPEKRIEVLVRVNPISVASVELDVDPLIELELNNQLKITASVLPAVASQEVIWESSDESIVSVSSDGEITAIQYGEAIISAKSLSDENKSASVKVVVVGLVENMLDTENFSALPHSSQFEFSPWGTSDVSVLWNGNFSSNSNLEVFYILNKTQPYFGIDLGVKAKLTSIRFWGRKDNYFVLRHPKKFQIYGTNDPSVANDPESADADWTLLSGDVPFESIRPSGGDTKPEENSPDWLYANAGERFSFATDVAPVRYIRFKSLETWGKLEGLWATEIGFWGEEVD